MPGFHGAKVALRDQLETTRRRHAPAQLGEDARLTAEHLMSRPELVLAATVACYVSVGHEPGTGPLLEALRAAGKRVLLPRLEADDDLDWGAYAGPDALVAAGRGLLQPTGEALGREAVATADVVVVPALAVDRTGLRLGRGGGSYDRALARVTSGTFRCALLHEGELLDVVPAEPHDRRVDAVATPSGIIVLRSAPA